MNGQKPFDAPNKDLNKANTCPPFTMRLKIKPNSYMESHITVILCDKELNKVKC